MFVPQTQDQVSAYMYVSYHDVDVFLLFFDICRDFHLVEWLSHGVEKQLVFGQPLKWFHDQVDQLQPIARLLTLSPLHKQYNTISQQPYNIRENTLT